jgi:hypothetical protein
MEHAVISCGQYLECHICGTWWSSHRYRHRVPTTCEGPKGRHARDCECPDHGKWLP